MSEVKRGRGRPKKIQPAISNKGKAIILDASLVDKIEKIRTKLSETMGFQITYSQAITYLLKDK
jgi:hypothetical protein